MFQIGSLGDSIVSLPTLLSLKELLPDCPEYVLISRFDSKLKVLPSDIFDMAWKPALKVQYAPSALSLASALIQLRYYRPKYCVYLMPSERESEKVQRDARFFRAGGIKNLIGFQPLSVIEGDASPSAGWDTTEAYLRFERVWGSDTKSKFEHYCRQPLIHPNPEAVRTASDWLSANRRHKEKRLVVVAPYSNWSSKDIPDHVARQVIEQVAQQANVEILIVGGKKDLARSSQAIGPSVLNACGQFSLQESAAAIKMASLLICADSGPMHLAGALNVPVLAIYSRIGKRLVQWLPFGEENTILYRNVDCAGCVEVDCPVQGHPCMEGVPPQEIIARATAILRGNSELTHISTGTQMLSWSMAEAVGN